MGVLSNLVSTAKQIGQQAGEDANSVAQKSQQIDNLKQSMKPTAPSAPSTPVGSPSQPAKGFRAKGGAYGSRPGEQRIDTKDMVKPLGSFKKGGRVKKTGVYKLHKGEHVLTARQTGQIDMAKKSGAWHALAGMDKVKGSPSSSEETTENC